MRHIRNLISAIILYDKEGLSTLSLYFFEDKNTFYSDTQIVDNGKMFAKVIELNSKDLRSAFDEWHKNFYMKFVPTHLSENYGLERTEILSIIPEFPQLQNNTPKKYQVRNFKNEISEFHVKVFYNNSISY